MPLFCVALLCSAVFSFLKTENKVASAYTPENLPTGTNAVGNIYDLSKGRFDRVNLDKLAKKAKYNSIDDMIEGVQNGDVKTSSDFGNTVVNFGKNSKTDSTTQEFTWIPAYLSNSGDGPILTLWLATNSEFVYYSDGTYSTSGSTKPSSNNYSTSMMRARVLNNGGTYYSSYGNTSNTTTPTAKSWEATSNGSNSWEMFTTGELSSYIVSPSAVGWQNSVKKLKNDPFWEGNTGGNYPSKTLWLGDKLWLPSVYEIYDSTIADNSTQTTFAKNGGLWQMSADSLDNPQRYWTRSAMPNTYWQALQVKYGEAGEIGVNGSNDSVRPALHLNLSAAAENATIDAPQHIAELTFDGESKWIDNLGEEKPEWLNLEIYNSTDYMTPTIEYTDTKGVKSTVTKDNVKGAGTYKVTMTLSSGLKWSDGDGTGTRSFTITVAKTDPTVTVSNPYSGPVYMPSALPTLTNTASDGTAGTFSWRTQIPKEGANEYTWYFTPTDDVSYNSKEGKLTFDYMVDTIDSIEITNFNTGNKPIYTNTSLTVIKSYFEVTANYHSGNTSPLTAFVLQIDDNNGKLVKGDNNVTIFTSDYAKSASYTIQNVKDIEYTQIVTLQFSQTTFTYPVTAEQIRDKISLFKVKRNDDQTVDVDKSEATIEGDLTTIGTETLTLKLGDLTKTFTVTIDKGTYDMSGVELTGETDVTYNGQPHALTLSKELPAGVSYTVKYNGETTAPTDAGTYTVVASFTYDTVHYNTVPDLTETLIIKKATVTGIAFADAVKPEKTGEAYTLEATGMPDWVTVSYSVKDNDNNPLSGTSFSAAGTYKFTATFTIDAAHANNYEDISPKTATLTISDKPVHNMDGVKFEPDSSVLTSDGNGGFEGTYNGDEFVLGTPVGLPSSVTVTGTTILKLKEGGNPDDPDDWEAVSEIKCAGDYNVITTFDGGNDYATVPDIKTKVSIGKATVDASGVTFKSFETGLLKADGKGGYTATYDPDGEGFEFTVADLDPASIPAGANPKTPVYKKFVNGAWETVNEIKEVGEYKVVVDFEATDLANYNANIAPAEVAVIVSDAVVTGVEAALEEGATFTIENTLDEVKAKLTVEAVFNNGTKEAATEFTVTCATIRDGGLLEVGTQTVTVNYSDGTNDFTTDITITVAKVKVALPTFKGGLNYTGIAIVPTAENFEFNSDLVNFVKGNAAEEDAINAGDYKAVFALKDADRYEWNTVTTNKKSLFKISLYDDASSAEVEVDWRIDKAIISATTAAGSLPVFASESFKGLLADIVGLKYYTDPECTQEIAADELGYETTYYVKAELLDTANFYFDESAEKLTRAPVEYTTPAKELTFWEKVVVFLKTNWLWIVIAAVALILLITIIACCVRASKKKKARLEKEEQRRIEKEEREREERRLEREERMARLSQQQSAPAPQYIPQPMPQFAPQMPMQSMGGGMNSGGASSNEIAELKAEMAAMKAEQAAKEMAELKAAKEIATLRAEVSMRDEINALKNDGGKVAVGTGMSAEMLAEIVTAAMEKVLAKNNAQPAQQTNGDGTQVPPDAVMTTVTTTKIDTTKKTAQNGQEFDRDRNRSTRSFVAPMPVDDGRVFDVGGFYKPADPSDFAEPDEDGK